MMDDMLLVISGILTIGRLKISLLSSTLSVNFRLSIEITTSMKVTWLPLCSTFSSRSVGYISIFQVNPYQIDHNHYIQMVIRSGGESHRVPVW